MCACVCVRLLHPIDHFTDKSLKDNFQEMITKHNQLLSQIVSTHAIAAAAPTATAVAVIYVMAAHVKVNEISSEMNRSHGIISVEENLKNNRLCVNVTHGITWLFQRA